MELRLVKQGACLGHQAPLGSCPVPAGALLGLLHAPQLLGGLGSIPVPRLRAALLPPGVRSPFLLRSLGSAAWKGAAEQGAVQESQTSPQQSPLFFFCISVRGSALLWLGRGCLSPLRPHGWCAEGFYQSTFKLLVGCKAPGAASECCWPARTRQIFSDIGVGMPGEAQGEGASGCCGARTHFGPQHTPGHSVSRPFEPCRASPGWSAPFPAVISTLWMVPGLDTATQDKAGSVQEELCPFWVARERGEPWTGDPTPPDVRREERAAPGCPPGRKVKRRAAGA